jgi:hypothetical protein
MKEKDKEAREKQEKKEESVPAKKTPSYKVRKRKRNVSATRAVLSRVQQMTPADVTMAEKQSCGRISPGQFSISWPIFSKLHFKLDTNVCIE